MVLGTVPYFPPEQAAGRVADIGPLSDVYSVGTTLYYILSGSLPFKAASNAEMIFLIENGEPCPLRRLNSNIPRDLESICYRAMQKAPNRRYGSMANLQADLNRFLSGDLVQARHAGFLEKAVRWMWRRLP